MPRRLPYLGYAPAARRASERLGHPITDRSVAAAAQRGDLTLYELADGTPVVSINHLDQWDGPLARGRPRKADSSAWSQD